MATKKRRTAKAKRATKETSDEVSSDAGKLLRMAKRGQFKLQVTRKTAHSVDLTWEDVHDLVVAVAGSALVQDQRKGRRKR